MKLYAKPKIQDLDAFAFYQGAHDVPLNETLLEIASAHNMEQAKLQLESIRREKPLEATIDRIEQRLPETKATWDTLVRRLGHTTPPVATAVIVGLLGLAALLVDALLLGPGLDAVGISDPVLQFAAAFGLAALSATTFHLAYETFGQTRHSTEITVVRRGLGVVAILSLLAWGVLRGYQVKFGADLNGNPLGGFLGAHPLLASIFFCFVTLAAPLVGAAAFHDAAPRIHDWRIWKQTKNLHETLSKELAKARKGLEEERLTLKQGIAQLDAQQQNWQSVAAQYHERGRIHGARQSPHWLVLLKATLWSLGGLALGCTLGTFFAPLFFLLPCGTWAGAFLYYRHRRFHPSYDQFRQQENTQFAIRTDRPRMTQPATPRFLPPPEDKA